MNIFSFVKSRVSILDVVNEYTQLKKAGLYWKSPCPFHSEKDASFTVSPHKEIFYCFGCHAGGDVISFIEKIEGCSPLEAVKFLIDRYNIEVPESIEWEKSEIKIEEKNLYFNLCDEVAQWAHQELLRSREALAYLKSRGTDKESIDDYGLGYFPGGQRGVNSLLKAVKKKNIMPHDLMDVHIITEGKGYMYSPFEERIMFPIRDHLGRCCGFGGRIFKEHDERAKYYNSRENSYFQKGKIIFGLNLAKNSIQKKDEALLVEGYTDCISMRQVGYHNVVSTLGTACTVDHLTLLARYCDSLGILYDGDAAGQQAILRLVELSWGVNLELRVISLPEGEDPASFLMDGGDIKNLIEGSKNVFEFFLESMGQGFQSKPLGEKVVCVRKVLGAVAHLDDGLKRAVLLQQAAVVFGIPFQVLESELAKIVNRAPLERDSLKTVAKSEAVKADLNNQNTSMLEKKIFFAIMSNIQIFNSQDEVLIGYFSEPLRSILKILQQTKIENPSIDFVHFFDQLDKDYQRLVSGIMLECDQEIDDKKYEHLLDQFKRKHWKLLVRALKTKIDSDQTISDSKEQLLNDFLALKKNIFKDRI